ncbi:hypothetical protein D9V32_09160 [Mycetocola tolaasinivorans]|uniref:Uncharacterized protein n=1 Tax=Mycetocola tolaasinivorans TaxID=76635 RepID=A0A3L7A7R3_9MICO|nr:hypothetical protein D9V32_09160 [Mycetocola tolaasinivorans]
MRGEATAELYAVTLDLILEHHTRLDEALIAIHSDEFGAHLTLTPESAHRLGIALVAATRAVLPSAAEVTSGGAASTEPPQSE